MLGIAIWLSSCCPSAKPPPSSAAVEPDMHVVMVHGFLEDGRNYKMLRKRLEEKNVGCHVIRLEPSDGRVGIEALAESMKEQIHEKLGPTQDFSIVGYSMGGLVSRYYLQNMEGAKRCKQFITVATPHHGTVVAHCYFGKGAYQMRRGSKFLKQLAATEDNLGDMPITSYRTPLDLIIVPSTSSIWERAENRRHWVPLHPLMLNVPTVLGDIEERLMRDRES